MCNVEGTLTEENKIWKVLGEISIGLVEEICLVYDCDELTKLEKERDKIVFQIGEISESQERLQNLEAEDNKNKGRNTYIC